VYNTSINSYQIITSPSGTSVSEGNIPDLPGNSMVDDGNFHRSTSGSSPVDAGIGDYLFLTHDILGGVRDVDFDAGAEEFGANGTNLPYDSLDVGVSIGFGAISTPTLATTPTTITFGKYADTMTFEVIANVDWTIAEDIPWLNLDITSGSGNTTISANATENTTGADRMATFLIQENEGGNGLSSELTVLQLNTFIPAEIPIVGATSIGMQDKEEISEKNAYNDDLSNYWTGDPDTEPEVSITFDLGCPHVLTEIGINFWKADERTTTFSIAISNETSGPFTTIIDTETSSDSNVTVDTEQKFSLNNSVGRYVKFIGIGNSSSTNWTSIANVNVYGDVNCESLSTGVSDNQQEELGITIFPIPATEGIINISSETKPLNRIEIYNAKGQLVLIENGKHSLTKQIDITQMEVGMYFIKIKELGTATFIVN
jgi:poly(beta-D-mannuronate) lyase